MFFPFKDKISPYLRSNVVYRFACPGCKAQYIGETNRNLLLRFAEHKGVSFRTGRTLSNPPFSAIRDHSHKSDHQYSIKDFKVISSNSSAIDTKIMEALHIEINKPTLNNQNSSNLLNLQYRCSDPSERSLRPILNT